MKHWDLIPGETVTLRHAGGQTQRLVFLGRDTRFARFRFHDIVREFRLRLDGDLSDTFLRDRPRLWSIDGPDRHTRGFIDTLPGTRTRSDIARHANGRPVEMVG
jgi:hypothetical protein